MLFSQILAMKDASFEEINRAGMRKLDTNTHIIGSEKVGGKEFDVLLIASRGKKLDNKRMGEKPLCSGPREGEQLTLASNGMVDADLLKYYTPDEIIGINSIREMKQELNLREMGPECVLFEGLMVDTHLFTGAFGIVTSIRIPFMLNEINIIRSGAIERREVDEIYPVENTAKSIAEFLRDKRDGCLPQLITGIVIYGYNKWGSDFLKEVTK